MSFTNSNNNKELVFKAPFAEVLKNTGTGQQQLSATQSFSPGETICAFFAGSISDTPTYLTVQTGETTHITLQPEFLQYINHSCDPNVFFDTDAMTLVCLQPIEPGTEMTFFYPSTEWEMNQPFLCQCGTPNCLQIIQGASFLSTETLLQYRLTNFIQQKLHRKAKPEIA